jgi:hypothetical protein
MKLFTAYTKVGKWFFALSEKDRLVYNGRDFEVKDLQKPWKPIAIHEFINPKQGRRRIDKIRMLLKFIGQLPPGEYKTAYGEDVYQLTDGERTVILPFKSEEKHSSKILRQWKKLSK